MIILSVGLIVFALYAWLIHVATTADRNAQGLADLVLPTPTTESTGAGYDLIDTTIHDSMWTVLDDHQLDRLLKESAPTNGPDLVS